MVEEACTPPAEETLTLAEDTAGVFNAGGVELGSDFTAEITGDAPK